MHEAVGRFMNNPTKEYWLPVKWILRYLRGATRNALCFGSLNAILQGYIDFDIVSDKDGRRNTIGYVFIVGGTTISWILKRIYKRSLLSLQ